VRGLALLRLPVDDYLAGLEPLLRGRSPVALVAAVAAAAAAWWVYLPVHELLHALGCVAGGGSVSRLEIDAMYGAAWLQRIFPFVAVGSRYAGQLTGFDTGGSDLTYLLTDALPYALTILIGVPALRASARRRPGVAQAMVFGAALPVALAPFISLAGDYYEMGSIVVSRLVVTGAPALSPERWRSDDLFLLVDTLRSRDPGPLDAAVVTLATLLGTFLAFLTYAAGTAWARWLEDRRRGGGVDDAGGNV
jgi:hypothetical protein